MAVSEVFATLMQQIADFNQHDACITVTASTSCTLWKALRSLTLEIRDAWSIVADTEARVAQDRDIDADLDRLFEQESHRSESS